MSINERIILYLNSKSISKYRFYKETGLSNGFLDKKGNIGSDKCEIISSCYPDLNIEWVITGKGSMLRDEEIFNDDDKPIIKQLVNNYQSELCREKDMLISELKEMISVQREIIDFLKNKLT